MGKQILVSLLLIFLIFFLPWLWGGPARAPEPRPEPQPAEDLPPQPEEDDPAPDSGSREPGRDSTTVLNLLADGKLQQTDMETYLMGVVRAEMPAAFHQEALKAQAVAARTYILHKIAGGGSANHPQADACDDITCCQAYKTQADAAADWGEHAAEYEEKIRRAVTETDGECVLYEGAPVLAVFHSSSVGTTQDAQSVWSASLPYLQSVETPEGEDTVPNYRSTAVFSAGGVEVGGNRLRTILDLRSACFTIAFDGDEVTFSVSGYGHGVGMSQYGSNVLAEGGMTYQEILKWYYTGTEVGVIQ